MPTVSDGDFFYITKENAKRGLDTAISPNKIPSLGFAGVFDVIYHGKSISSIKGQYG